MSVLLTKSRSGQEIERFGPGRILLGGNGAGTPQAAAWKKHASGRGPKHPFVAGSSATRALLFTGEIGILLYQLAATDLATSVYAPCVRKSERIAALVNLTRL